MKAFVLTRFGDAHSAFQLQDIPLPSPAKGQVLIRCEAFGLNYADIMARKGLYRDAPPLPCVIGYEVVGRIEKCGEDSGKWKVGQRVAALTRFGGYAEFALTDARAIIPIPDDYPVGKAAALATQYCTAWYAAKECVNLFPGAKALVHAAAGGVGTALIQMLTRAGVKVFGTVGSDEKIGYIQTLGAEAGFNYRKGNFVEAASAFAGREKFDFVFDSVGGKTFADSFKLLAAGGKIIGFGASSRSEGGFLELLRMAWGFGIYHPGPLLMASKGIIGVNMLRLADHNPEAIARCMKGVESLLENKMIDPHVGAEFPATQLTEAHQLLESRNSMGKIVVKWN